MLKRRFLRLVFKLRATAFSLSFLVSFETFFVIYLLAHEITELHVLSIATASSSYSLPILVFANLIDFPTVEPQKQEDDEETEDEVVEEEKNEKEEKVEEKEEEKKNKEEKEEKVEEKEEEKKNKDEESSTDDEMCSDTPSSQDSDDASTEEETDYTPI